MITLKAKRGKVVHATPTYAPDSVVVGNTFCGKNSGGWVLTDGPVTCPRCIRNLEKIKADAGHKV